MGLQVVCRTPAILPVDFAEAIVPDRSVTATQSAILASTAVTPVARILNRLAKGVSLTRNVGIWGFVGSGENGVLMVRGLFSVNAESFWV